MLFFLFMVECAFICVILTEGQPLDGKKLLAAFGLLCFPAPLALISLYAIWDYLKKRLVITKEDVFAQGVFGAKRFQFSEISSVDWGKSASWFTVKFRDKKLRIYFNEYLDDDFDRIVFLFRTRVPEDKQKNWCSLCYRWYARPSRTRDIELQPPDPSKGEVLMDRRRWDRFSGMLFLLTLPLAVMGWFLPLPLRNLLVYFPLLPCVIWLVMRFAIPKKGHVEECVVKKSKASNVGRPFLLLFACWILTLILAIVFPEYKNTLITAGLVAVIPLACWLFVGLYQNTLREERRMREERERFEIEGNLYPAAVFRDGWEKIDD